MFYRIVFYNKSKGFKKKIHVTVSLESVGLGSTISMDPINTRGRSRRLFEESLARGYCWVLVRTRGWRSVLVYNHKVENWKNNEFGKFKRQKYIIMDQDNRFAALTWVGTGYFCEVDLYWNYVIHLSYCHAHAVKRRGGLMVSALDSGSSCVLRQDTLLSQCFSSPRCTNAYQQICWG